MSTKKVYESPVVIPLGELVQGSGNCAPGSAVTGGGGNCKAGGTPANNCLSGTQVPPGRNCNLGSTFV